MENGYPQNGRVNGVVNGASGGNGRVRTRSRPFTVDEALPYSPFSSVVPFNSDIIPAPTIGLRSSASLYSTSAERNAGRQGLESLNREAEDQHSTSQRLEQTLGHLQRLLQPEGLTQYKFRTQPKVTSNVTSQNPPKMTLTSFAQKVYDNTSVEFRYPTPDTPSPPLRNTTAPHKAKPPTQPKAKLSQNATPNVQAHKGKSLIAVEIPSMRSNPQSSTPLVAAQTIAVLPQNPQKPVKKPQLAVSPIPKSAIPKSPIPKSQIEVIIPGLPNTFKRNEYTSSQPTPDSPPQVAGQSSLEPKPILPPSVSNPQLAVVIPDLPPTFRPQDYEVVAVPDSPTTPGHLSKKRKYSEYDDDSDGIAGGGLDQREKADAAFRSLHDYLRTIFEAQDQFDPGLNMPTALFVVMGEEVVLVPAVQTKVDTLLQKIIELGRFSQVPLDDLLRLLRLCDGALKATESVDLKVDEAMGESEVDVLAQQISDSELGLKAARICLRLMSGGREEKQLYSEDVIQAALNAFKNSMENCVIPIVEMRSSGASASSFKLLSTHKKLILNHLSQCKRLFKLMATLVANIDLSETVLNTLEFTASRLIFVENAHVERDSILGVSKFDGLRVVAMDVLAQIFLNSPTQRQGIFDEILTSLEKLPVTKQSARQFKIPEGGSIQLVSALIMRLIQTSASKPDEGKAKRRRKALEALDGDGDPDAASNSSNVIKATKEHSAHDTERRAVVQHVTAIQELDAVVAPLLDTAKANAIYVVGFIVNRAQKSTKSGDTPYRNLLDLFVEDFITCLRHPDWPAAELLLRLFVFKMVALAEGDKTAAPAKNMALDLLGLMAAAISDLNSHIQKSAHSVDIVSGDLGEYLSRLAIVSLEKKSCFEDIVAWTGPYRASLESLQERCGPDTQQLDSAVSFLTSEWAAKVTSTYELISDEDDDHEQTEQEYGRLAFRLRMMLSDKKWLSREYDFNSVAINQAKLAYGVILLHSQFCESFGRVLQILLTSMASEQATVRSKSIKSVNQLLETDPTILDRNDTVRLLILRCANDPSVQVRDSALGLIGKCITLRPTLEEGMIPSILQRVTDGGVGVRKRAMKLCKDIYLRNSKQEIRSSIADSLLHRVTDFDEGVQELARQTIEEVWLSPFYQPTLSNETSPQFKLALADQVALMTKTLHRGSDMSSVLDKVLQSMLSESSKAAAANFRVCTALVAAMFETIIDNPANEGSDAPSARNALQVLTIFAKSNAKLFTPDQIMLLQPYVNNVGAKDDLAVYRSVVVIFRHVLPHMSKAHNNFLVAIRNQLFPSITRMNKFILDDLMACLWIISETLDDYKNLASTAIQTLTKITAKKNDDLHHPSRPEDIPSLIKLLTITGMLGKHCNLDPQLANFKQRFPSMKGNVSRLMADTFAPFANPKQPVDVRKAAMEAIGMVCQSWPKNFTSANIYTGFREVFDEGNTAMETIILRSWKEFLAIEEKRSEAGAEALPGSAADPAAKLGVMGGSQGDGVALSIAQMFLADIIRIALATQDDQALLATEVLASINRQGLVHPKETAKALIALETSQNTKISELAFQEHRAAHEKHETILEKEYMSGVYQAYCYHRDVTKNVQGATINPYVPKLHRMIEVLKISKTKNRKKFYEALCKRIDFDPVKMEYESLPEHLEFSQFIIENMAFFEYASIDELMSAISAMEKVVSGTGTGIAHAIETEIFHVQMDQPSQVDENGVAQPIEPVVNSARLGELTAFSMVLSSLWQTRTYLRRQYGLTTNRKETKGKAATKDLNKPPVKAPGINGDKLWEEMGTIMNSSTSQESMMAQCRSFVELLSVDEDFKLTAEGDEDAERTRLATPSDDEGDDGTPGPPGGSGRGRKRKAAGTPGNRKKRARSTSKSRVSGHPRKKSIGSHESDHEEAWN